MTPDPRDGDPLRASDDVWDEADGMCPNCVTPWKCNGPHLDEQTVAAARRRALPIAGHQGCARWWLLWLAVGAAFWAAVARLLGIWR